MVCYLYGQAVVRSTYRRYGYSEYLRYVRTFPPEVQTPEKLFLMSARVHRAPPRSDDREPPAAVVNPIAHTFFPERTDVPG